MVGFSLVRRRLLFYYPRIIIRLKNIVRVRVRSNLNDDDDDDDAKKRRRRKQIIIIK